MRLAIDDDALNDSMTTGVADRGRFEDEDRARPGICCFGNKADKSKTSQTVNTHDESQIVGAGGLAVRDGDLNQTTIISSTDHGAIAGGVDIALGALDTSAANYTALLEAHSSGLSGFLGSLDNLLGFAVDSQKSAALSTKEATSLVAAAYQGSQDSSDGNRTVVLVGLSVVGLIAVVMLFKGIK